jgi:hypothetical protein
MPETAQPPAEPRLGAALIFGADANHCVHVHTGPDGITAIRARLDGLHTSGVNLVAVVAVLGTTSPRSDADRDFFWIPASAVEDVVHLAMEVNQW